MAFRGAWKLLNRKQTIRVIKRFHHKAFSHKYLLLTNISISFLLSSTGDVLEQHYEIYSGELEKWDKVRTCHMGLSGMSVGVVCHYWYQYLDTYLPSRTIAAVAKKIILDQLICSPIYITIFFVTMGILERKTTQETIDEIKEKAWRLYAAEWMVWPAAQFINFYWLPLKYRIFYDNLISLGYDVYTSQVKNTHSNS